MPQAPLQGDALGHFLRKQGLVGDEPLLLSPLSGGQSNPTFRLKAGERDTCCAKSPQASEIVGLAMYRSPGSDPRPLAGQLLKLRVDPDGLMRDAKMREADARYRNVTLVSLNQALAGWSRSLLASASPASTVGPHANTNGFGLLSWQGRNVVCPAYKRLAHLGRIPSPVIHAGDDSPMPADMV
jgi:hypothetical protein